MADKDRIKRIVALVASGRAPQAIAEAINEIKARKAAAQVAAVNVVKEAVLADRYSGKDYTFDEAYKDARSKGQKTFFWNGKYYNTDYEGEHGKRYREDVKSGKAAAFQEAYPGYTNPELRKEKQEELDTYGITNEQTKNKSAKERILRRVPARDYNIADAISGIVGEYNRNAYYSSPEDAIRALNGKYDNAFSDFDVRGDMRGDAVSLSYDRKKAADYRSRLDEDGKKKFDAYLGDIDVKGGFNVLDDRVTEMHRPEYDMLLGYPLDYDKNKKNTQKNTDIPTISRYRTGSLPYYYSTERLDLSMPFLPSSIAEEAVHERDELDELTSEYNRINEKLNRLAPYDGGDYDSWIENRKRLYPDLVKRFDEISGRLWDDSLDFARNEMKDGREGYWNDRGVEYHKGLLHIVDLPKFVKNASESDYEQMRKNHAFANYVQYSGVGNDFLSGAQPGNHLHGINPYYEESWKGTKYDDAVGRAVEFMKGRGVIPDQKPGDVKNDPKYIEIPDMLLGTSHLGAFTVGIPQDKSYFSVYDKFDIDPFGSGNSSPLIKVGKPFEYYTRFYPEGREPDIDALYNGFGCGGKKFDGGGKFLRINLQDQSPYPIDPQPFINYPIETPYRFRPEPDLGDYERPVETGMIQSIPVQVYNTFNTPQPGYGVLEPEPEQVVDLFSDEAKARRRLKQAYAESGFRKKAQSKAGAKGLFQIMDITHKDYLGRGRGKSGDIYDPEYNGGIRDWVMKIIPRDLQEFWSEDDSDRAKLAKLYAAYNWGAGNLRSFLRKKRDAGVDISNPDNWVDDLNPETRRYVKYLAFDEDIPDSTVYTNAAFEKAAAERGYANGGRLFEDGGPEKTYQDYLDEYRSAKVALDVAKNNERAVKTALRDFRQGYTGPDGSWSPYWYWTSEGKRLDAESNIVDKKLEEARNAYFSASDNIGNATLEKYRGTSSDPMAFWEGIATTKEGAEKYFRENAIRESAGAQEVADYFKSYANSPGYARIRNNQEQWWKQRHPYKKIYEGTGKAMGYTDSLQSGIQVSPYGVFDLSVTPQISKMRTRPKAGMITVGTNEEKDWPYWFVLPHEMAHIANTFGIPYYSAQAEALSRNTNTSPGHDSELEEKHSDKEALMFMLYKEGIYDSRGEKDCTPEDIAKLRKKYPDLRPLQQMDDEKAAWMINHVADAGEQESLYGNHLGNISANGGKIRIKPSHRGRLTELKERTGKTEAELYDDGNPAHKRMVVFARNSRKWKHGDGGPLDKYGDEAVRNALLRLRAGNKFDGGGEEQKDNNVPIWHTLTGVPRTIKKLSRGRINDSNIGYVYDYPEEWANKIFSEDEIKEIRQNLYDNFLPGGYRLAEMRDAGNAAFGKISSIPESWDNSVSHDYPYDFRGSGFAYPALRDEAFATYLQIPQEKQRERLSGDYLVPAVDSPQNAGTYNNVYMFNRVMNPYFDDNLVGTWEAASSGKRNYYTTDPDGGKGSIFRKIRKGKNDGYWNIYGWGYGDLSDGKGADPSDTIGGTWTLSTGVDPNRGQYVSYYDNYELNPSRGGKSAGNPKWFGTFPIKTADASGGIGNPFSLYDRVYLDDYYGVNSRPQNPDEYFGGYVTPSVVSAKRKVK